LLRLEPAAPEFLIRDLHRDLRRDGRRWTQTERFSAVIILAATIAVVVPAAVEFTQQIPVPTTITQR